MERDMGFTHFEYRIIHTACIALEPGVPVQRMFFIRLCAAVMEEKKTFVKWQLEQLIERDYFRTEKGDRISFVDTSATGHTAVGIRRPDVLKILDALDQISEKRPKDSGIILPGPDPIMGTDVVYQMIIGQCRDYLRRCGENTVIYKIV